MIEQDLQIARYLQENIEASGPQLKESFTIVDGIKVTFPYQTVENNLSRQYLDEEMLELYYAGKELTDNMPSHWVAVAKEADELKKVKGADCPVNILHGILRVSNNSQVAQELGLTYPRQKNGWLSTDKVALAKIIDNFVKNPRLRAELVSELAIQVPDDSGSDQADHYSVIDLLNKLGISNGIMVDIGSGLGRVVNEWARQVNLHVVGIDRQYDAIFYRKFWKNNPNLSFIQGDALTLPLKDSSVKVSTMENVVQHMTEDALVKTLPEIRRVLQPNSLLFVGPSWVEDWNNWIVLKKEFDTNHDQFVFNRYTITEIAEQAKND